MSASPKTVLGWIGESVRRADGTPKTTGEFAYASDLQAAGMLWGHTLRAPHAHARIRAIDLSAALTMPGVHAVLTHEDVPGRKTYGLEFHDQPVLAIDRVRYFGEPVAVVAAEHPEQARRAAERIVVDYEPLPPIADPERATESEPLHPARETHESDHYLDDPRPNVVRSMRVVHGDPDARGDVVVEGTYEIGTQDQAFLGPESGLAVPDGEGGVDIYVATQWLHVDREQVAPCLALPEEQVRIHLAGVGGAFGGREDLSIQIHAALLALHTSRPVKMVYNRQESFTGHVHRHPARIHAQHHATREGRLVSVRMQILLDGGAYASSSTAVTANATSFACGPYAVPNAHHRDDVRVHEQPSLRRDARLRRGADVLRRRGADGQACACTRARPDRAAPAERARARRHAADGAAHRRLAAGRGGHPALRRAPRASTRRICRARRSACPAGPATRRAARA